MEKSSNTCLRCNPNGDLPDVDSTAYVDPSTQVIGNVHIGSEVYVGPNAVIRADESDDNGDVKPVVIGSCCNVQDGAIVHALAGTQVRISPRTSLAHGCIIHGPCNLGQGCFIGFRAVIYVSATSRADSEFMERIATANLALAQRYIRLDEHVLENSSNGD